ncbi:hypothetical protein [Deinococcus yavapaiensis]|uniref:DNA-binding helix-hairpin-helix protein with protein kinase domain n=1 Tax=Deinococcus yavapaiensis KR-236 TaxID=694435 RepID=A0A318S2G0_9DEIO|nr:hypothetical protein [Deinococcus yavapaiensis]PYE52731.1 DNA-binding helix-hairpin-helix protein with protein kinase domain [Deinococcus yavapaiensis KR-236]
MTDARKVRDASGSALALGRLLGRGGEGSVYEVASRPEEVVKLYERRPSERDARKIALMTRAVTPELVDVGAWPLGSVHDASGVPVGVRLPRIPASYRPLHDLTASRFRAEHFPQADWRFLVRVARHLAQAVDVVHRHGHVIGDLNPNNILVGPDARVRFIDVDSFQVTFGREVFPCGVGTEAFTPPELQGHDLRSVRRTRSHDRFGLATAVFLLLFSGRYPFAGVWAAEPPALGEAIRRRAYAYGPRTGRSGVQAPPGTLPVIVLPRDVRRLFERAFTSRWRRPGARAWTSALHRLERSLVTCARNPSHAHPRRVSCPWCALDAELGTSTFRSTPSNVTPVQRGRAAFPGIRTPSVSPSTLSDREVRARVVRVARGGTLLASLPILLPPSATSSWGVFSWLALVVFAWRGAPLAARSLASLVAREAERVRALARSVNAGRVRADAARHLLSLRERRARALLEVRDARDAALRRSLQRRTRRHLKATLLRRALDDAELARILAAHGVLVAADLEFVRLRAVSSLTARQVTDLLHWRLSVERAVVVPRWHPAKLRADVLCAWKVGVLEAWLGGWCRSTEAGWTLVVRSTSAWERCLARWLAALLATTAFLRAVGDASVR